MRRSRIPDGWFVVGWLVTVAAIGLALWRQNLLLAAAFAAVGIFATIAQLKSPRSEEVSWAKAKRMASKSRPPFAELDSSRPLVGMILEGASSGRYVWFVQSKSRDDVTLVLGLAAGEGRNRKMAEGTTESALVKLDQSMVRYLPQGRFSDEVWRRNFNSIRRGDRYRALPSAMRAARPNREHAKRD